MGKDGGDFFQEGGVWRACVRVCVCVRVACMRVACVFVRACVWGCLPQVAASVHQTVKHSWTVSPSSVTAMNVRDKMG